MHPFPSVSRNKLEHELHKVALVHEEQNVMFPPYKLHLTHFKLVASIHIAGSFYNFYYYFNYIIFKYFT